jgi:hypothetical protein
MLCECGHGTETHILEDFYFKDSPAGPILLPTYPRSATGSFGSCVSWL